MNCTEKHQRWKENETQYWVQTEPCNCSFTYTSPLLIEKEIAIDWKPEITESLQLKSGFSSSISVIMHSAQHTSPASLSLMKTQVLYTNLNPPAKYSFSPLCATKAAQAPRGSFLGEVPVDQACSGATRGRLIRLGSGEFGEEVSALGFSAGCSRAVLRGDKAPWSAFARCWYVSK